MKKSTLKLLFILGIMIIVGFYLIKGVQIVPKADLEQIVTNALTDSKGIYGIVIKNLKTGETYSLNSRRIYKTGSLYKLWIMATVFEQIQMGAISEDETLTGDIAVLNKKFGIDPEAEELTKGTITLTVQSGLRQMITISHNYASLLLTERVKLSTVKLFLEKYGFKQSKVGSAMQNAPVSSPNDIALFLEKLYRNELANQEYTEKMLNLLKMQKLNDKLPKYLPRNVVVAHKTGEIDFLTHDSGIVYTKNGDYIIVVFSESNSPSGAEERIAQISKVVYRHFN